MARMMSQEEKTEAVEKMCEHLNMWHKGDVTRTWKSLVEHTKGRIRVPNRVFVDCTSGNACLYFDGGDLFIERRPSGPCIAAFSDHSTVKIEFHLNDLGKCKILNSVIEKCCEERSDDEHVILNICVPCDCQEMDDRVLESWRYINSLAGFKLRMPYGIYPAEQKQIKFCFYEYQSYKVDFFLNSRFDCEIVIEKNQGFYRNQKTRFLVPNGRGAGEVLKEELKKLNIGEEQ